MTNFGRIGVIGAGALGALYGARLARLGCDVHFIMRNDWQAARERGLEIRSWQGNFTLAQPNVHTSAAEMGRCDLILVGLKATENHQFPQLLRETTHPGTIVLTLQNGLGNEDAIAAALESIHGAPARDRVVGAVAFLCSTRIAPAVINHTDHGRLRLAEFSGPAVERTHALAELFRRAEFPVEVSDSLALIRWEKLVWNVPFSGLGVAALADAASVLANPDLYATARTLMAETIAAANANGAPVPVNFSDRMVESTLSIGAYRSSMQLDFEARRPIEVEAILGEPCRRALAAGISVPALRALYGIVRRHDQLNRGVAPT